MAAIRLKVEGRVQGVGYRFYTVQRATAMGIRGEVWNRWDSGVEVIAEHESESVLHAFQTVLENGPGYVSAVTSVQIEETGYTGFEVGQTR